MCPRETEMDIAVCQFVEIGLGHQCTTKYVLECILSNRNKGPCKESEAKKEEAIDRSKLPQPYYLGTLRSPCPNRHSGIRTGLHSLRKICGTSLSHMPPTKPT